VPVPVRLASLTAMVNVPVTWAWRSKRAATPPELAPNNVPSGASTSILGEKAAPPEASAICTTIRSPWLATVVQESVSPAEEIAPMAISPEAMAPWP
jgi:hypothetical protein